MHHTLTTTGRMVSFAKMHGTGNDFIVLDNRAHEFSRTDLAACAGAWCPRRYGVGADGLLALDHPRTPEADYRMHYVNADGSRATMCGNGARCLFRFARRSGFDQETLAFDTDAGLYRATVPSRDSDLVRLFVPEVTDLREHVQLEGAVPEAIRQLHYVHAGTEHLVAVVKDVDAVPVRKWGHHLRHDSRLAPAGANVNFMTLDEGSSVRLRTYEKGVEDETPSCGTGVLAAASVAQQTGQTRAADGLRVQTNGGTLHVGRASVAGSESLYLEGPAVFVFDGQIPFPDGTQ